MSYSRAIKGRNGYARYAAPESIRANIKRVRTAIREAEAELHYLQALLEDRENGIWPGLRDSE